MTYGKLIKGKKYQKTSISNTRGGQRTVTTYVYLIVDKRQDTEEIQASIIPEVGKPTAPLWYGKNEFQRWKPYEKS